MRSETGIREIKSNSIQTSHNLSYFLIVIRVTQRLFFRMCLFLLHSNLPSWISKLSWTNPIRTVSNTASRKTDLLYKTKHYYISNQLSAIYKSHIMSQMEYFSPSWDGAGQNVLGRLDRLKNRALGSFMIWFRHKRTERCTTVQFFSKQ